MGKPKIKEPVDFCGWATVFNRKCSDGRTILKHAFKECDGVKVPLVWMHGHDDIGNVLGHAYLEEREEGMYAYCCLNNNEAGKQAKEAVQHGDICALSIFANRLQQNSKKEVTHGVIREVSLVLAGANPGAYIDAVISHADDPDNFDEATIFNDKENSFDLEHSEDPANPEETPEEKTNPENKDPENPDVNEGKVGDPANPDEAVHSDPKDPKETENDPAPEDQNDPGKDEIEHKDTKKEDKKDEIDSDKTIDDVLASMTEEQRTVTYLLMGIAAEEAKNGGNKEMKHNCFEAKKTEKDVNGVAQETELSHSEFCEIITEAKKTGSLKEAFLAHGVTNIERLFPEDQLVNRLPQEVKRDQAWAKYVMNHVHKTPFSRVKSTYATMTADEARARGYVKGKKKVEEVIAAFKRSTTPQTVYKLQKLDRDDVIDITDFDVIAWIKGEMRGMLDEELARAFLIGDGRDSSSDDKINPLNIRPIWGDDSVYTVSKNMTKGANEDEYAFAKRFIKEAVKARKEYKGSGNPVLFTTEDLLTDMLLIEDLNQRVIYDTIEKLKTALRVNDIITVPVMENQVRESGGNQYKLMGIFVNLDDYNVGADKGGAVSMFDDFDIDYNKYEYLIETRCSGALVKPYSAIVFEEKGSF